MAEIVWGIAPEGNHNDLNYALTVSGLKKAEAHEVLTTVARLLFYRAAGVNVAAVEGHNENLAEHPEVIRVVGELLNAEAERPVVGQPPKRYK